MMSSESNLKLSELQQRRITDNFRAAKAKLAQKRLYVRPSSSPLPPLPPVPRGSENESPMEVLDGGKSPPASPNFRSPTPAKRMCTPSLPNERARAALGTLSGNKHLPDFHAETGCTSTVNSRPTCISMKNNQAPSSGLTGIQASYHSSVPKDLFNKQLSSNRESGYVVPGDVCEDFDEEILRELDEICNKSAKKSIKIATESIDSPNRLASRLYSVDSFSPLHESDALQVGLPRADFHDAAMGEPELSASPAFTNITISDNVSSRESGHLLLAEMELGGEESMAAGGSILGELLVLAAEALVVPRNIQCLTVGTIASSNGIAPAISELECPPVRVISATSVPSLTQSLRTPGSDKFINDTELPGYLRKLNMSQREAALSDTSKPLLILAGPGSGKTSTMVARLLTLLKEGVEAKKILALTFTTAASTEMRQRVAVATGKSASKELTISTFHSFCLQLCRAHADKLGRSAEFLVYGHGQQRRAVIEATRLATLETQSSQAGSKLNKSSESTESGTGNCSNPTMWKDKARRWQQFVTQAKAAGKTSMDYEKMGNTIGAAVLRHYEATLTACNALDYHDFITFAVSLLEENSEVLDECQRTWTCVLVDEFQDTSTTQYRFLRLLASHNRVTIVGDDDQSIFSFNGANTSGFDSFRQDFPLLKEVRLHQNYRSTRCIVEAATSLIQNNKKRCQEKHSHTDNAFGDKVVVMECRTEQAECSFVVDSILMNGFGQSSSDASFGSIAVLYRRQVTGRMFQTAFRTRKIPFNVHGIAVYRKKVTKNMMSVLWTVLPGNTDVYWRRVLKALYSGDKSECKRVVEYVDKVAKGSKSSFRQAAETIFTAKISGTFSSLVSRLCRKQLALGRRVLRSIDTIHRLAHKEHSLSGLITAVVNLLPQRPVFDSRAIVDEDGGKLLNEDDDPRTVLEYILDDVNDFLSNFYSSSSHIDGDDSILCGQVSKGDESCLLVLKAFLDHLVSREADNFQQRRKENTNSVTLTTMHQVQSQRFGMGHRLHCEVKANDTEMPLLNEGRGQVGEGACSLELEQEERRLFYVAMTRARKKLYICYVVVNSQRQVLQPSRFLKELPRHLLDFQGDAELKTFPVPTPERGDSVESRPDFPSEYATKSPIPRARSCNTSMQKTVKHDVDGYTDLNDMRDNFECEDTVSERTGSLDANESGDLEGDPLANTEYGAAANTFLRGFNMEARSTVAALFNNWARKPAFQNPKRLVSKVGFVVDERLRSKNTKNKDVLIALKCCLKDAAALSFASNAINWVKLPAEERALLQAERQEHFQQVSSERSMGAAAATPKQVAFLRSLGCIMDPTSRLHASKLIEQYKKL